VSAKGEDSDAWATRVPAHNVQPRKVMRVTARPSEWSPVVDELDAQAPRSLVPRHHSMALAHPGASTWALGTWGTASPTVRSEWARRATRSGVPEDGRCCQEDANAVAVVLGQAEQMLVSCFRGGRRQGQRPGPWREGNVLRRM